MSFKKNNLRVAVCTEAIIYLPFYLAYLSNDFKENPYNENLEVALIDKDNDLFIESNEKLRGDDFVLFCLLFDIADIGICDTSILIHFFEKPNDFITPLTKFQTLLKNKNGDIYLKISKILNDNKICLNELEELKDLQTKIIGTLVSDIAVNYLITETTELQNVKKFTTHPAPSTLFYLISQSKKDSSDFGIELKSFSSLESDNAIVTCDLLASELITTEEFKTFKNNAFPNSPNINICEVQTVRENIFSNEEPISKYSFTGLIGNFKDSDKSDLIKGFLYCIDKKLYKINTLLSTDVYDLKKYISHKLLNDNRNISLVNDLLISNSEFYDSFFSKSNILPEEKFNFLITCFVNKLVKLRKNGIELFNDKVDFTFNSLEPILNKRINKKISITKQKEYARFNLLKSWRVKTKFYNFIMYSKFSKFSGISSIIKWNSKGAFVMYLSVFLLTFSFFFDFHEYNYGTNNYQDQKSFRDILGNFKIYLPDSFYENTIPDFIWDFTIFLGFYILLALFCSTWVNKYKKFIYDE